MGGTPRTNALSNRLYYDNSNFHIARIQTNGDFDRITGFAGINDATECPENTALLHIENERGQTLWGPRLVQIGSPIHFSADLHRAIQVELISEVTRSNSGSSDACVAGDADPAWGGVQFVGASG